jgi:hypothetical protein
VLPNRGLTLTTTHLLRTCAATAALRVQLLQAAEGGDLRLFKSMRALRSSLLFSSCSRFQTPSDAHLGVFFVPCGRDGEGAGRREGSPEGGGGGRDRG